MAIKINLKELFSSQNQDIIVENINYNFRKLLEMGIGENGEQGNTGLSGPPGPPGPIGNQGVHGVRGSHWLISPTDPSLSSPEPDLIPGDMWVNSNTGDVYVWTGSPGVFVPTGFSFANPAFAVQSGEFKRLANDPSIPGTENQFITFKNVLDNSDSTNDTFLLTNFDPTSSIITNRDFSSTSLYNSIFSIFRTNSSRYHLVLGSLFTDASNVYRLTTQDETVKIKYDYVGSNLFELDILLTKQASNPEATHDTQLNLVTRDSSYQSGFKEHVLKVGKNPSWITGISLENGTNGFGMGFDNNGIGTQGTTGQPFIIKRDVPKIIFYGNTGNTEYTVFENERIGLFKAGVSPSAFLDVNTLNQTYSTFANSVLSLLKFDRLNATNDSTNFYIEHTKMFSGAGYKADATLIKRTGLYVDGVTPRYQEYGIALHAGFSTLSQTQQTPIVGIYNTTANPNTGLNNYSTLNDRINAGFNAATGQLLLTKQYNSPIQSDLVSININSYNNPGSRVIIQSSYVTPYNTNHPLIDLVNQNRDINSIHLMPGATTAVPTFSGSSTNVYGIGFGGSVAASRITTLNSFGGIFFTEIGNASTETIFTGAINMYTGSIRRHLPLMRLSTGVSGNTAGNKIYFYGQTGSGSFITGDDTLQSTILQTASNYSRFKIGNSIKEWRFNNNGTLTTLPELAIKTTSTHVELRSALNENASTPVNLILNTLTNTNYSNVAIGTFNPNAIFHVANETTGNEFLAAFTGGNGTYPRIGFTLGADSNIALQSSVFGAFYGNYNWDPVFRYITDTYKRLRFEQQTEFASSARLNNNDLYFRSYNDINHGLGWYQTGSGKGTNPNISSPDGTFATSDINGPVLFGFSGGALGSRHYNGTTYVSGDEQIAIYWTDTAKVRIGDGSTPAGPLDVKVDVNTGIGIVVDGTPNIGPNGKKWGIGDGLNSTNGLFTIYDITDNQKVLTIDSGTSGLNPVGTVGIYADIVTNDAPSGWIKVPLSSNSGNVNDPTNTFVRNKTVGSPSSLGWHGIFMPFNSNDFDNCNIYYKIIGKTAFISLAVNNFSQNSPVGEFCSEFRILLPPALQNILDRHNFGSTGTGTSATDTMGFWHNGNGTFGVVQISIRKYTSITGGGEPAFFNNNWILVIDPFISNEFVCTGATNEIIRGQISVELN